MITSFGTNYPISIWIFFFLNWKIFPLGFDTTPWSITYFYNRLYYRDKSYNFFYGPISLYRPRFSMTNPYGALFFDSVSYPWDSWAIFFLFLQTRIALKEAESRSSRQLPFGSMLGGSPFHRLSIYKPKNPKAQVVARGDRSQPYC